MIFCRLIILLPGLGWCGQSSDMMKMFLLVMAIVTMAISLSSLSILDLDSSATNMALVCYSLAADRGATGNKTLHGQDFCHELHTTA